MKKKFSDQRDNFLKKYKGEIQEGDKELAHNSLICNICHSNIDSEKEEYGVPAYFSWTNLYDNASY